jgi:hypothetical protein
MEWKQLMVSQLLLPLPSLPPPPPPLPESDLSVNPTGHWKIDDVVLHPALHAAVTEKVIQVRWTNAADD